jgi:surface carbohydrate biosynthesis protein
MSGINAIFKSIRALKSTKFEYYKLDKSDYLVMDEVNSQWIIPLLPKDKSYYVLENRGKSLQVRLTIILGFVRHSLLSGSPFVGYLSAVLDEVNPEMVITYIDNSRHFYNLNRYYKNCRFLAIQNAARFDIRHMTKKEGKKIFLSEFVCFGQYEIDLYTEKQAKIGHFLPLGSLKNDYYKQYKKNDLNKKNDICFVCEPSPGWDLIEKAGFEAAVGLIATYALRFARENKKTIHFAGKRAPDTLERKQEIAWYKKYIGETANCITANNKMEYSTYQVIDSSSVSIGFISTAFTEAMNRKNKCLICNFTGYEKWDFPIEGPWFLSQSDYPSFENAMNLLLNMSNEDYVRKVKDVSDYLMKNNKSESSINYLKRYIADATK